MYNLLQLYLMICLVRATGDPPPPTREPGNLAELSIAHAVQDLTHQVAAIWPLARIGVERQRASCHHGCHEIAWCNRSVPGISLRIPEQWRRKQYMPFWSNSAARATATGVIAERPSQNEHVPASREAQRKQQGSGSGRRRGRSQRPLVGHCYCLPDPDFVEGCNHSRPSPHPPYP